jgi:hypothetical protein
MLASKGGAERPGGVNIGVDDGGEFRLGMIVYNRGVGMPCFPTPYENEF